MDGLTYHETKVSQCLVFAFHSTFLFESSPSYPPKLLIGNQWRPNGRGHHELQRPHLPRHLPERQVWHLGVCLKEREAVS
jgi:hypothetical protein